MTHSTSDLKSAVSVTWTPGQSSTGWVSPSTSTSKEIVFPKTVHHVYEGCDINKTCYGLVNDCDARTAMIVTS